VIEVFTKRKKGAHEERIFGKKKIKKGKM